MSSSRIGGTTPPNYPSNPSDSDPHIHAAAVTLNVNGKKLKLLKKSIEDIAQKYAKIAKEGGHTNDDETFSKEMTDAIFAAFQEVEKNPNF